MVVTPYYSSARQPKNPSSQRSAGPVSDSIMLSSPPEPVVLVAVSAVPSAVDHRRGQRHDPDCGVRDPERSVRHEEKGM